MKKKLFLFTTVLFSISSFAQIPISGLIYNYEFSKSYNDNGSSGNHGINHGSTFRRDRCFVDSNAVSFDGVNDYVNLGSMDSLNKHLKNHSISFWIKSELASNKVLFGTSNNSGAGLRYSIGFDAQKELYVSLRDVNSKVFKFHAKINSLADCEWHHIVMVMANSSTNSANLYLDGKTLSYTIEFSKSPALFTAFNNDIAIGAFNERGTIKHFFTGSLDDVLFYDRSLSAAEALQLFNTSCPELKYHDTTFVQDTTFVNDTITEVTLDTVLIYTIDTLYQTVYDTTSITSYDTVTQVVYDTITITSYDTIYTTYTIAVEDTLIVNRYTDNCGNVLHKIYPNPTKDYLYLSSNGPDCFEGYKVQFIDALGKILETKAYGNLVTFDIRGYARSLYFLRLIGPAGDAIFSEKIILD